MSRCDSEAPIRSASANVLRLLQSAQIEHQGHYSTLRLQSLQDYINYKFTPRRLAALLLIMPCPVIAIITLMELAPLNSPTAGPDNNVVFWIRFAIVSFIQSVCFITIANFGVFLLDLTLVQGLFAATCATSVAVATGYICAITIGFPVPFIMPIISIPSIGTLWVIVGVFSFRRIFANPKATKSLQEWMVASSVVSTQLFIYPLYNYAFRLTSPLEQTALSILLGVVKINYRLLVGKIIKQQGDYKAVIVTFTAETYHAMFVAFSMQNATSIVTIIVLLAVDILHSSSLIYDVHLITQALDTLDLTICAKESNSALVQEYSLIDRIVTLISLEHAEHIPAESSPTVHPLTERTNYSPNCYCGGRKQSLVRSTSKVHVTPHRHAQIMTGTSTQAITNGQAETEKSTMHRDFSVMNRSWSSRISSSASPRTTPGAAQAEYIATSLHLLHLTEFTMLGELVEVVVPIIYTVYTVAMVHSPNRSYCSQLASANVGNIGSMTLRMLSYGLLGFISLILLDRILQKRLRFSPTAQLGMVLESRWALAHSGLIIWVVYTVQGLLDHFGADFSFQFTWLHTDKSDRE